MKIEIKKAYLNVKCQECGEVIYPNNVWRIRPERIANNMAEWKFCEKCFNEIFTEEVKKKKN